MIYILNLDSLYNEQDGSTFITVNSSNWALSNDCLM
jgi:hypothetical protein